MTDQTINSLETITSARQLLGTKNVHPGVSDWFRRGTHGRGFVGLGLSLAVFILQFALALQFNMRGGFDKIDLLFDADTKWYLEGFETGGGAHGSWGGRGLAHLNVTNLINPPIAAVSVCAGVIDGPSLNHNIRRILAVAVAPCASGVRTFFVWSVLSVMGCSLLDSLLFVALSVVCFSGVLFGSIPESFGLSGACFAYLSYLAAAFCFRKGKISAPQWLISGALLFSITITNIVPFGMVLFCLYRVKLGRIRTAILRTGIMLIGAIAISCAAFLILTGMYGAYKNLSPRIGQLEEVRTSVDAVVAGFYGFPRATLYAFAPPEPNILMAAQDTSGNVRPPKALRITFRKDIQRIANVLGEGGAVRVGQTSPYLEGLSWVLFLSVLAFATVGVWKSEQAQRTLAAICLLQIAFHWVLHSVFGKEPFLYTLHWLIPLIVFISTGLMAKSKVAITGRLVLAAFLLLSLGETLHVLNVLLPFL